MPDVLFTIHNATAKCKQLVILDTILCTWEGNSSNPRPIVKWKLPDTPVQSDHPYRPWKLNHLRGLAKNKIQKIRVYYGSGCVGPGLSEIFFWGKSSKNCSKPVLICWSSIQCVFCLCTYTIVKSC